MAATAGKGGKVSIGVNDLAFVESWEMSYEGEMLETTGLGTDARTYIAGLTGATASVTLRAYDHTDTATAALWTAVSGGTSVTADLYLNATKYYSGTAFVSSWSPSTSVDGLVTASAELQFSGAVTYN